MTYRHGLFSGVAATLIVLGAAAAGWYLITAKSDAAKPAAPTLPATVPKPFKEDQAPTVTLTTDAEARLELAFGEAVRKPVRRQRTYGGEVVVPPGRSVIVSAPLAGKLVLSGEAPYAGEMVGKGQTVFQLLPLLDPVGRATLTASKLEADGLVQNAAEQLKLAEIALKRAKDVLAGGAGSQKMVDETQTQVEVAHKTFEAAKARRDLLNRVVGEAATGTAAPIPIPAPQAGLVRNVSALAGQVVPANAALFEIMDLDEVWVRVPVYVGEIAETDTTQPARVGGLTGAAGGPSRSATLITAPPVANPAAGTVDLFYSTLNWKPDDPRWEAVAATTGFARSDRARLTPGQRVGVAVPLKVAGDALVVPWAAVVIDVYGGTWVYERADDRAFARHRVVLRYVHNGEAVLASGPKPGTRIVTNGAAELFGAETGFSK